MSGIKFRNKHSADDFGMFMTDFSVSPPELQTAYVDVPFRDGLLDFSTALTGGIVRYQNRTVTASFVTKDAAEDGWRERYHSFINAFHGRKEKLIFDYDPDYYYLGRITCDASKDDQLIGAASITADCDPYKYKLSPTVREFDVSGSEGLEIILQNDRMPTVPTVTTDAEITVEFGESTIVFAPGTRKAPDLLLLEGANHMTLTGTGHIKFEYQEGAL